MCLGAPGKIVAIDGTTAIVDFWGVRRKVALDIVDEPVACGDHVLVHVGFAIRRIAPEDVQETLAFFEAMTAEDLDGLTPAGTARDPS
jgi:hydrogenase expression/formation protein HypC